MTLADIQRRAWSIAETQGQHEGLRDLAAREQLLIRCSFLHGEVAEIADIAKKHGVMAQKAQLAEECADVLILLAELCEEFQIDLTHAVTAKMAKNRQRPYGYGTPLILQEKLQDRIADHFAGEAP